MYSQRRAGFATIQKNDIGEGNVMSSTLRTLFAALLLMPLLVAGAQADQKPHRLALQISDSDAGKMNAVLNVAANVSKYYSEKGEEIDIQIVAFNAGLDMLRQDKSPVLQRLTSFKQGMPNVSFMACENTLHAMARNEGKEPPLVDNAKRVPAGVVTLIELGEKGWTIVRP
jgi:intracellular sulfur oxidation DsrE/DsrF family protein